ncbi:MAG: phosphoglucomutase/phosphomannomutase family protein, partial [Deltaproteobacteria bacterium]
MEIKFGTSGWRAVIADTFTFENVRLVTQAIADHITARGERERGIVVGYDTRFLSRNFAEEATRVLLGNGIPVWLSLRDTPTPVLSWEILRKKSAGAINFTASHNPPHYNGIKFSPAWGGPALPETTRDIESRANAYLGTRAGVETAELEWGRGEGLLRDLDPRDDYLAALAEKIDVSAIRAARLKILVNPIFGTGRGYLDTALERAGCTVATMNMNPDPTFGGISPEPSEAELEPMKTRVAREGFDLGLATDGDADRFGIIDAGGYFIEP